MILVIIYLPLREYKAIHFVLTGDKALFLFPNTCSSPTHEGRDLTVEEKIINYHISRGRRISKNSLVTLGNRYTVNECKYSKRGDQKTSKFYENFENTLEINPESPSGRVLEIIYTSCYFKDACWRLNNEYALVTAQAEREVFSNKTSYFNWAAFILRNDTAKGEGIRGPCKMFSFAFHVLLLEIISRHAFAVDVSFTNSFFASLDENQNVKLYWNVSGKTKEIFFTVEANTLGWIGFGISRGQGKMQGADIVIGWVKDGKPYFQVFESYLSQLLQI